MSTVWSTETQHRRTELRERRLRQRHARWPAASAATQVALGPFYACPECFGPLEVAYDFPAVTRERDRGRPAQHLALQGAAAGARRHRAEPQHRARLHPAAQGRTTSAATLGIDNLWVKDDSDQPDQLLQGPRRRLRPERRPRARRARSSPAPRTGNLANAVAAAGARAGIKTVVFIPSDLEQPKQVNSAVYTEHAGRGRTATTTTSTGSPPRSPARRRAGRSSTSTSARTTPRAPRRSATRSPSSSAGGCPTRSSSRSPPARS